MRILKISQKIIRKKKSKAKKEAGSWWFFQEGWTKRWECKVCKRLITIPKKCWHKGKPQCNFCKKFGHVEKDCWHKKREQENFCEKQEEEREEKIFFASKFDASTKSNEWYVDSGCTNHMTGDGKTFLSINNSITTKVKMRNGALVDVKGKGTISINMKESGEQIHDVFYLPDLEKNLLTVGQLMENGYSLVFRDNYCRIYDKIESKSSHCWSKENKKETSLCNFITMH